MRKYLIISIFVTEVALAHSSNRISPPLRKFLQLFSDFDHREVFVAKMNWPIAYSRTLDASCRALSEQLSFWTRFYLRPIMALPPREECEECELFPSTLLSKPSTLPLNDFTISRMCLTLSYSVSSSSIMRRISRMRAISRSAAAMEEADLEEDAWIERVVWALSYEAAKYCVSERNSSQ